MPDKPSYLGTLNAIVNGERRGFEFLNAWSERSPDPDISLTLKTVALREAEHAATFEKRMCELGYNKTPDEAEEDELLRVLADKSIDPQTGALLGRFIAEERDSGRILREAYLCARKRSGEMPDSARTDQAGST